MLNGEIRRSPVGGQMESLESLESLEKGLHPWNSNSCVSCF